MKLLTLSSLYPNAAQPRRGVFIEHRLRSLLRSGRVEVRVVAPVPWFPFADPRFGAYAAFARAPRAAVRHGIEILHPRYPTIPKVGMTAAPFLLAAAMVEPLRRLIRDGYDFDLIDAFYLYPDGVAAALLGQWFGKPVVVSALGTDVSLIPRYALPRHLIQWMASRVAGITTVCRALKDELVALGVPDDHVRVILHGVDLELFRPPADRAAERSRLGLAGPTLLSVGNLVELKGHHIAIEALTELPDTHLAIAGDGEEEKALRRLAQTRGVAGRVRFLGHVDQRDLRAWLGAADALVLPSSREGIANVLIEAMACGTPVVATRVWGTPEVVTAPEAGVLIPERTPAALAAGVRALLAAPPDRAATRRFAERFSWAATTEQHLALLDEVLAR